MTSGASRTPLVLSGLPGKMARAIIYAANNRPEVGLCVEGLGSEGHSGVCEIEHRSFRVVPPAQHRDLLLRLRDEHPGLVAVDYSTPQSAAPNAELLSELNVPFVMGTSGCNAALMQEIVRSSETCAVIAANMAPEIVMVQAMFEWAAGEFPGVLRGSRLMVVESHQASKRDTSGTAKAIGASLEKLGAPFDVDAIHKIRDPEAQRKIGVPTEHLEGHGWHRYSVDVPHSQVHLEFVHNVCGRAVYAEGALRAALFLSRKASEGARGRCYSMLDVLRGA